MPLLRESVAASLPSVRQRQLKEPRRGLSLSRSERRGAEREREKGQGAS